MLQAMDDYLHKFMSRLRIPEVSEVPEVVLVSYSRAPFDVSSCAAPPPTATVRPSFLRKGKSASAAECNCKGRPVPLAPSPPPNPHPTSHLAPPTRPRPGTSVVRCEDKLMTKKIRQRQLNVGVTLFNQDPNKGIRYLYDNNFLAGGTPPAVAKFLRSRVNLSKARIGEYLCDLQKPFNLATLRHFVNALDFSGRHLDEALRILQRTATFRGETQKIETAVRAFGEQYARCNPSFVKQLNSRRTLTALALAVLLLEADLQVQSPRPNPQMTCEDFVKSLRGVDGGADLNEEMLRGIYGRVKDKAMAPGPESVYKVASIQEAIRDQLPAKLAKSDRRFVSLFRLDEVGNTGGKNDILRRGIFVFNDLFIVCEAVGQKKVTFGYKFFVPLKDLCICLFRNAQCEFGIHLKDQRTGENVAIFNAPGPQVQLQFVDTLYELMVELKELQRAKMIDSCKSNLIF